MDTNTEGTACIHYQAGVNRGQYHAERGLVLCDACWMRSIEEDAAALMATLRAEADAAACPNHSREAAGRCPFCDCGAPSAN